MAIQSIHRAISILSLFSYDTPRLGIMDMANALNLGKGTVHNIVKTLCAEGLLKQEPETRKYILGTKLFSLGAMVAGTLEINQKATTPAASLVQKTGLHCRVGIWDSDAVLVTLSLERDGSTIPANRIGPRLNAYGTAIGRALLANIPREELTLFLQTVSLIRFTRYTITDADRLLEELNQIRKRGYAINDQELILGRASIAAPIFSGKGNLAGSLALSGTPDEILGDRHDRWVDLLFETTGEISRRMGTV